jgi:hypothetical protein
MSLRRADHSSRGVQPSELCSKSLIVKLRKGRLWPGIWSKRRTERQNSGRKVTDDKTFGSIFLVLKNSLFAFYITSNLFLNNSENYKKITILKCKSNNKVPGNLPSNVKQNCTKFEANVNRMQVECAEMLLTGNRHLAECAHENRNTDPIIIIIIIIIIVIYMTPTQITTLYAHSFSPNTVLPVSTPLCHSVTQCHVYTRSTLNLQAYQPVHHGIPRDWDACDGEIVWLLGHFPAKIRKNLKNLGLSQFPNKICTQSCGMTQVWQRELTRCHVHFASITSSHSGFPRRKSRPNTEALCCSVGLSRLI